MLIFLLFFIFSTGSAVIQNPIWLGGCMAHSYVGSYSNYNSPADIPYRFYSIYWTTPEAVIIFGGFADINSKYYNDLYISYDLETFYWLGGCRTPGVNPGNYSGGYNEYGWPLARGGSAYFRINNTLFLFGGNGLNGKYNDFFSLSLDDIYHNPDNTKLFKWISGTYTGSDPGSYTEYYAPAIPTSRNNPMFWTNTEVDVDGIEKEFVFMYGGIYWSFGNTYLMNDTFRFNGSGDFIWISGCGSNGNDIGYYPEYGQVGRPPARRGGFCFTIKNNVYLFGGIDNNYGYYNDLWKSTDNSRTWVFINGCTDLNNLGTYDKKTNIGVPHSRAYSPVVTIDDYAYLIGGTGPVSFYFNDVWSIDQEGLFRSVLGNTNNEDNLGGEYLGYGKRGFFSGRCRHTSFTYNNSILVMFGFGYDYIPSFGMLSDIWSIPYYFSNNEPVFRLTTLHIVFLSTISFFLIGLLAFFLRKPFFLYSHETYSDKFLLIFPTIAFFSLIVDVLLISSFFVSNLIFFIAALSLLILSFVLNYFRLHHWNTAIVKLSKTDDDLKRYIKSKFFYYIINISILNPNFLFFLKSNSNFPLSDYPASIVNVCVTHDVFSVFPQAALLYSFLFTEYDLLDFSVFLWICILFKIINQVVSVARLALILIIGGKKDVKAQKNLKFGLYRTVGTPIQQVPSLIDTSNSLSSFSIHSPDSSNSSDNLVKNPNSDF